MISAFTRNLSFVYSSNRRNIHHTPLITDGSDLLHYPSLITTIFTAKRPYYFFVNYSYCKKNPELNKQITNIFSIFAKNNRICAEDIQYK